MQSVSPFRPGTSVKGKKRKRLFDPGLVAAEFDVGAYFLVVHVCPNASGVLGMRDALSSLFRIFFPYWQRPTRGTCSGCGRAQRPARRIAWLSPTLGEPSTDLAVFYCKMTCSIARRARTIRIKDLTAHHV